MIAVFSMIWSSDSPDGLVICSSKAFFSASACCCSLNAAEAFSLSAIAIFLMSSWALRMLLMTSLQSQSQHSACIAGDHALFVGRHNQDLDLGAGAADDALSLGVALGIEGNSQPAAPGRDLCACGRIILADSGREDH